MTALSKHLKHHSLIATLGFCGHGHLFNTSAGKTNHIDQMCATDKDFSLSEQRKSLIYKDTLK